MYGNKKLYRICTGILLGVILMIACLMILSKFNIGNFRFLSVKSGSMSPHIYTGSVILVLPQEKYTVGDVITFRSQGQAEYVTHRIIEVDTSTESISYRTKGDANDAGDEYKVPNQGIIGKVRIAIPLLGYVLAFTQTPLGVILIIIIPTTVIIYDEIKKISREWKRIRLKKTSTKTKNASPQAMHSIQVPSSNNLESSAPVISKQNKTIVRTKTIRQRKKGASQKKHGIV